MFHFSPSQLLQLLEAQSAPAVDNDLQEQDVLSHDEVPAWILDEANRFDASIYNRYVKSSRLVARELHLLPGEQALVLNGRVGGCSHFIPVL
jgi:hypothetical protein